MTRDPVCCIDSGMAQLLPAGPLKHSSLCIQGVYYRNVTDDLLPLLADGSFVFSRRKAVNEEDMIFQAGQRAKIINGPEGLVSVVTRQGCAWITVCPELSALHDLAKYETYRVPIDQLTKI